jgi:hypothetical protein
MTGNVPAARVLADAAFDRCCGRWRSELRAP